MQQLCKPLWRSLTLLSMLILLACAGPDKQVVVELHPVKVFYGTDRNLREMATPSKFYGLERGGLDYGVADVVVSLPSGKSNLQQVRPLPRDEFVSSLATAVAAADRPEVFVFIHGYNRSFHQVSKQVAQFADNTGFPGVPVMWSWPSSRTPQGYLEDETNMRWSQPHFYRFLRDLLDHAGAERVHLVGHSLGGRALVELTVQRLLPDRVDLEAVGEFVLLAPDIDGAIFLRDHAPVLSVAGLSVTLYTSANDKALASARTLRRYPRAGDSRAGVLIAPGIETIDVTAANRSILGHSYFDESEEVAEDLARLLTYGQRAAKREGLEEIRGEGGIYWRLTVSE